MMLSILADRIIFGRTQLSMMADLHQYYCQCNLLEKLGYLFIQPTPDLELILYYLKLVKWQQTTQCGRRRAQVIPAINRRLCLGLIYMVV